MALKQSNSEHHLRLVEQLVELRARLIRVILVLLLLLVPLLYFSNEIFEFVASPLLRHLPVDTNSSMIVTDVTAAFLIPFKLTFFVAAFLGMPYLLYQLWGFVAPALFKRGRRLAMSILVSSVLLFYAGVAFAYFIVFPIMFEFFTSAAPTSATVMPDISSHLDLVLRLFFAFGLAFEIPVATVVLIVAGVLSPKSLEQKRSYVIVGCFVIGMLLTPPDVLSQAMLAIPMWMLFEIGVFFGRMVVRSAEQSQEPALHDG